MVEVRRMDDVAGFLSEAGAFLEEREAEHNLILGICSRLLRDEGPFPEPPFFAVAAVDGRVVGAALRTPPHNLVLSESDDLAWIEPLALEIRASAGSLPGVLGPREAATRFVEAWSRLSGAGAHLAMANRIYRASHATIPGEVPGTLRGYEDRDRDLVLAWLEAFADEAMPSDAVREAPESVLRHRLDDPDGGLPLWIRDDRPVSLAGYGSPTPHGIRVGPVYTPPEHRGRGYAGALVGRMTLTLLERRRFCFLFTDLANPTANGLYLRVGYEPVTDVDQYAFGSG